MKEAIKLGVAIWATVYFIGVKLVGELPAPGITRGYVAYQAWLVSKGIPFRR